MIEIVLSESTDLSYGGLSENTNFLLFWKNCEHSFPNSSWYDAPIILLPWWTQKLKELCVDGLPEVSLSFMEGSYKVRLIMLPENYISVYFENKFIENTSLYNILHQLILAVDQMVSILAAREGNQPTIANLNLCRNFLESRVV